MSVVVVIPALDEAATVANVVARARGHAPVIVVDDGSHDATAAVAAAAGAEVLRHSRRLGKGQALRTGFAAARRRGATVVITLDADGQHDPDDIPRLLDESRHWPDAIVLGQRPADPVALPPDRFNALTIAGFFVAWASSVALDDTQSGFRLYPLAVLADVPTRCGGFVFETEILIAAAARGWSIREVPIRSHPRACAGSRFRPLGDGLAIARWLAVRAVARWRAEFRAADRSGDWRRWRRAAAGAGVATAAAPVLVPLVLAQALCRRRLPDFVSPLVRAVYSPARRQRVAALGTAPSDARVAPDLAPAAADPAMTAEAP
jgi:glycosyltransferase involved in cell wall biosynthesis